MEEELPRAADGTDEEKTFGGTYPQRDGGFAEMKGDPATEKPGARPALCRLPQEDAPARVKPTADAALGFVYYLQKS